MEVDPFDDKEFFRALAKSGARTLLIGRRALIALGLPVATLDIDLWIHIDDSEKLNRAVQHLDMFPNKTPEEARKVGRYVLENGMRVDVLIARAVPTIDGVRVQFDDVWSRRKDIDLGQGVSVSLPSVPDLIATKRFGGRAKDAEDIRLLHRLMEKDK